MQSWAKNEVTRQNPKDLPSSITAAERLNDYYENLQKRKNPNPPNTEQRSNKPSLPRNGGVGQRSFFGGGENKFGGSIRDNQQADQHPNRSGNFKPKPLLWCFLFDGPHKVADCPSKAALNALKALEKQKKTTLIEETKRERGM